METVLVIGLVIVIITWLAVLPFVILVKLADLANEIRSLREMLQPQKPSPVVPRAAPAPNVAIPHSSAERQPPKIVATSRPIPSTPTTTGALTAFDIFWSRIADWFAVRGDFAPKDTTREFAVATRWLVRVGAVLLVGAIAYFLMLAVDRGWIGPAQRVYGMMFWGLFGIAAGIWIKFKKTRYAILGEACTALGLVALYLSFGLGHRLFNPPVIASYGVAFAGLCAATIAAGYLSVRLGSLTIAVLGLAGGLLVPIIVRTGMSPVKLDMYLLTLVLGACVVAHVRNWTAYAFAAIAAADIVFNCVGLDHGGLTNGMFLSALYVLTPVMTLLGAHRRSRVGNDLCWAFVAISAIAWTISTVACFSALRPWATGICFVVASAVHAALAMWCRRRLLNVGDGVPVMLCIAVGFAAYALISFLDGHGTWLLMSFCLFAAVLAELHARTNEKTFKVLSLVVAAICIVVGMFGVVPETYIYMAIAREGYWLELLGRALRLWCLPALAAYLGWRMKDEPLRELHLRNPYFIVAIITGFVLLTFESHWFGKLFLPSLKGGTVTIVWAIVAWGALSVGIARRMRQCRFVGLGLLAIAVMKLLFVDTASLHVPGRVAVFGLVGGALIAGAFLYLKFKSKFEEDAHHEKQLESTKGTKNEK